MSDPNRRCAICPITLERFTDPVVASDGWTYDRFAIEQWMAKSKQSPCDSSHTLAPVLYPNHTLKAVLLHDGPVGPIKKKGIEVIVIDE